MEITEQKLKELTENYRCYYDSQEINEIHEGVVYFEDADEVKIEDINTNYLFVYETDEYDFPNDIRELVSTINKCKKDLSKFERGESFTGIVHNEYYLLMTEESLDELFEMSNLEDMYNSLSLNYFKKVRY